MPSNRNIVLAAKLAALEDVGQIRFPRYGLASAEVIEATLANSLRLLGEKYKAECDGLGEPHPANLDDRNPYYV